MLTQVKVKLNTKPMFGRRPMSGLLWASAALVFAVWPAPPALVGTLSVFFWPIWASWISSGACRWARSPCLAVQQNIFQSEVSLNSSSWHRFGKAPWSCRCSRLPLDCTHLARCLVIFFTSASFSTTKVEVPFQSVPFATSYLTFSW